MTDGHYPTYREMLEKVDWDKYGVVDGKARDPRCENCMVHCGYDPSGALGTNYRSGDHWKNFKYNFWPRPPRYPDGHQVNAFNGASVGKAIWRSQGGVARRRGPACQHLLRVQCDSAGEHPGKPAPKTN